MSCRSPDGITSHQQTQRGSTLKQRHPRYAAAQSLLHHSGQGMVAVSLVTVPAVRTHKGWLSLSSPSYAT